MKQPYAVRNVRCKAGLGRVAKLLLQVGTVLPSLWSSRTLHTQLGYAKHQWMLKHMFQAHQSAVPRSIQ